MQNCQDSYSTTFSSFPEIHSYHQNLSQRSLWTRCRVNQLHVEPLVRGASHFPTLTAFAPGTSETAVEDTLDHLGLAIRCDSKLYPVRDTAYKSLLDRAKVGGNGLTKLTKDELAQVLNTFLGHFKSEALVLVRDEKVSAVHSGDEADYSVLPIDQLLNALQQKLNIRFPGNEFDAGYSDHAITSAAWSLPDQKEDLIGTYTKVLADRGKTAMASRLTPGIRFITSDTGIASAKVPGERHDPCLQETQYAEEGGSGSHRHVRNDLRRRPRNRARCFPRHAGDSLYHEGLRRAGEQAPHAGGKHGQGTHPQLERL